MKWILLKIIQLYRLAISPFVPSVCRHSPSCSVYSREALNKHGAIRGSWLSFKRILKCHPWGSYGYDPVPDIKENTNIEIRNPKQNQNPKSKIQNV